MMVIPRHAVTDKAKVATTRTPAEIRSEIAAFESQFVPATIPAGTPDRKRLQREATDAAHAVSCQPANIARRLALLDELRKAETAAKRRATLAAKAADPQEQTRQWLMRWLRRFGLRREGRSGSGSTYYSRGEIRVRLSDHDVPETDERRYVVENGGFSWTVCGWQFRIDRDRYDLARDLVCLRRAIRKAGV